MILCTATKKDGTPCKGEAYEDGLCISHKAQRDRAEASVETAKPAFLKGIKRTRVARYGHRRIKMLRPDCEICDTADAPWGWWLTCEHDPYVGVREKRIQVPIYSEPLEDGSVVVERMEERVSWEPFPNRAQVSLANHINSGEGMERARAKGYIMPEDLRSPAYPNGIAPMCQFQNCFWQHDLREYRDGVFCREDEARVVALFYTNRDKTGSMRYGAVEVMHPAKMAEHLAKVKI